MTRRPVCRLLVLVAVLGFAGCAELRGGVVSTATPCAAAIPLANQDVRGHGTLIRVRALKRRDARDVLARGPLRAHGRRAPKAPRKACVLIYEGRFARGSGPRRRAGRPARYLVLLIRVRQPKVLARLLADELTPEIRRIS